MSKQGRNARLPIKQSSTSAGTALSSKPFPWKCPTCRDFTIHPETLDYQAAWEHDGRAYPINIPRLHVPKCNRCGKLILTHEVNEKISEALRSAAGLLTPTQIREQRNLLGLTQEELAQAIRISSSTLSRWETGDQIQQRSLDLLLRIFFKSPDAVRRIAAEPMATPAHR